MTVRCIPFVRDDDSTMALIRVSVDDRDKEMSQKDVMDALVKMITRWANETDDGKEAWERSSHDFNVGDLSLYEESIKDWMFESDYPYELGILAIDVIFCGDVEAESFDRILVRT